MPFLYISTFAMPTQHNRTSFFINYENMFFYSCIQGEMCCLFDLVIIPKSCFPKKSKCIIIRRGNAMAVWLGLKNLKFQSPNVSKSLSKCNIIIKSPL